MSTPSSNMREVPPCARPKIRIQTPWSPCILETLNTSSRQSSARCGVFAWTTGAQSEGSFEQDFAKGLAMPWM